MPRGRRKKKVVKKRKTIRKVRKINSKINKIKILRGKEHFYNIIKLPNNSYSIERKEGNYIWDIIPGSDIKERRVIQKKRNDGKGYIYFYPKE